MMNKIRQKGATLIELIIVIMILSILVAGSSEIVRLGFVSYLKGQSAINTDWQERLALERMTRDLHTIRSTTDITAATPNIITFTDTSGNVITYQVVGTRLMRNNQALADNIQNLTFNYFDNNGGIAANNADIRYVTITLANTTTGISLWNLT